MKIAIAGVPKAGKTTFSHKLGENFLKLKKGSINLFHTDDLIDTHNWSELSQEVSTWFNKHENFIIEGVAVPRALRKWLANNATGRPCDQLIWMATPRLELSSGQVSMAKGCLKVMEEIEQELKNRGVKIIEQ